MSADNSEMMKELIEALCFYADPDTYFAIGFFPDLPCGEFIKDFDESKKPGARARSVIKKYQAELQGLYDDR
ncbi:MAG: hypothetical protein PHF86_04840 [Candidatus Nanoarchaeia archaeon]|jgi:hypothetical protein|nr:hypothetical protein [Candidatus Nanoarchaeia archaeon]